MYKLKDIVKAKNPALPFTMEVVSINEELQLLNCVFCYSGRKAGVFGFDEVTLCERSGERQ